MRLSDLPSEIICCIALHIPTANGITHLAQTCRRIYKVIAAEESWLFRVFVQTKFPAIQTAPYWKDAACALTSRSRAVDRLGVIGRFMILPETISRIGIQEETRRDNPTMGYRPPIDSYEIWNGESWADRKEVLAWGAGNRLLMRTKQSGKKHRDSWISFNDVGEPSSHDDILGLHLLQPEHGKESDTENVIFGRRQGDIRHIALATSDASYKYRKTFRTEGLELNETDLMPGSNPMLCAQFLQGSAALYHTSTEEEDVQPFAWIRPARSSRGRKAKLLSSSRVAVATMDDQDSLIISNISPAGIFPERTIGVPSSVDVVDELGDSYTCKAISAMEPLNNHPLAGSPGDVFLVAWGDRTVRLHDVRSPRSYETTYEDPTDDNIIYSMHVFGYDRFLVGSGGNALIKLFDLRCTSYSYLDAQGPPRPKAPSNASIAHNHGQYPSKDFNIFLSTQPPGGFNRNNHTRRRRETVYPYRGPIYSMSVPSPSSPTVYTGRASGLIRLDFASTDDLTGPAKEWYDYNLNLGFDAEMKPEDGSSFFTVAGYERPDPRDLTTTWKLRKQHSSWKDARKGVVTGWDHRWEALEKPGAWRRQDT